MVAELETLLELLSITDKAELDRRCRTACVSRSELAALIYACDLGLLRWHHEACFQKSMPDHLKLRPGDTDKLIAGGIGPMDKDAKKVAAKVFQTFVERRMLSGHIFYTPDYSEWHLLYFNNRDVSPRRNHWEQGQHIHILNYLCTGRSAREVWGDFGVSAKPNLGGSRHVRFIYIDGDE